MLLAAIVAGLLARAVPLAIWQGERCVRDECTYLLVAQRLVEGQGITPSNGWLWAPGYAAVLAAHTWLVGSATGVRVTQIVASALCTALIYALAHQALPEPGRRCAARLAAGLYALSPAQIFFAINLWTETLYTLCLVGAVALHARAWDRQTLAPAAGAGVLSAICALFRGVATWAVPILALSLTWRRWHRPRARAQAALLLACALVVVAPYAAYATRTFGALVVTDRVLGQAMWLGNNSFPPVTFDVGNGQLSQRSFARHTRGGRDRCTVLSDVIARDRCEIRDGIAWILDHPGTFAARIPLRLAQLLTPHALVTRNLRQGLWKGLPQPAREAIVATNAGWSLLVVLGGAAGLVLRGTGAVAVAVVPLLLYHLAVIAALFGLSRFRAPLEPFLMIYAGGLLAGGRAAWEGASAARRAGAVLVVAALLPLMLWFLPAGWPAWGRW